MCPKNCNNDRHPKIQLGLGVWCNPAVILLVQLAVIEYPKFAVAMSILTVAVFGIKLFPFKLSHFRFHDQFYSRLLRPTAFSSLPLSKFQMFGGNIHTVIVPNILAFPAFQVIRQRHICFKRLFWACRSCRSQKLCFYCKNYNNTLFAESQPFQCMVRTV